MPSLPYLGLFRTRLTLMLLLVVLPALGLALYSNLEQRRIEKAEVREGATAISGLAAAHEENFFKNARQLLATLTHFPFLVLATNRPFCETNFSNLRKLSPNYLNFGLIETNGLLFCSAEPTSDQVNLSDRAYFQRVIQTKKFSAGDFQVGPLTDQPSLNFGYPVWDEHGQLRRVVYASLKLSLLSATLTQIPLPAGGTVTVIDRNGTVLARQPEPEKWVGKSLSGTAEVQRTLTQKGGVFEVASVDGVSRLHAVTAVTDGQTPKLFVIVGIPVEISFAHANQVLARNLIVLGLVAVVVGIAAQFYARRFFLRPVSALVAAAKELAGGNLGARIGVMPGSGELVELGRAFDDMAGRLERRQAQIEEAHQKINRLNQDLESRVAQRTAQLEAANQELEAFSYSVSHDLRAPIRHMSGFVNLLRKNDAGLDEKNLRYLDLIANSARQMGQLVDDLLSFSRMSRAELRQTRVSLQDLVEDVRRGLTAELDGRALEWNISRLPEVQGDPSMLRVVLDNLVANAIKYTRPRQPARIEIGSCAEAKEHIIFVRDNGVGFDMQYASKLFGVFQRLHHHEEFEGTGIGLANVRRIIFRHGGRTWAEGKEGEGATFYFSLPRRAESRPQTPVPQPQPLTAHA